jgi:catechol 2,3-dioxygenase-like lactoylglutathione lyase family enzyme
VSRIQLALNVDDIDAAVAFYSTFFDTQPAKRRPGYANFAVEDPPVKLVLFENPERTGTLNHLGVERASVEEVQAEADRLEAAGLALDGEGPTPSAGRTTSCSRTPPSSLWPQGPAAPDDPRCSPAHGPGPVK